MLTRKLADELARGRVLETDGARGRARGAERVSRAFRRGVRFQGFPRERARFIARNAVVAVEEPVKRRDAYFVEKRDDARDEFVGVVVFVDERVDYAIPSRGARDEYVKAIERLPGIEAQTPEVFGLHPNAEIDYYTNASKKLWRDLLDLQPRTAAGGGGITRDEYIANVASDIQAKQPALFDLNKLRKELEADGYSPVFVVLVQELERWEILNNVMNKSLVQIKRALLGEIAMSGELDAMFSSMLVNQVPGRYREI